MILAQAEGFHVPEVTHLFTFRPFFTFEIAGIVFEVTFPMVLMFGLSILVAGLFVAAFRRASVVPGGLQNTVEAAVGAIRENIVMPTIGPHGGDAWLPFLTAMFFFIFALNIMEIVPFVQFPITSRIAIPAFMAILSLLLFNVVGIRTQGFLGYFKSMLFPPGVPKPIYIILTPIEFFSTLIVRPLTLAVRLLANMMAGHVMLTIFFLATGYWLYHADSLFLRVLTPAPFVLSVILVGFEAFIALIQAFIFTILTAVYIAGALHPEH